ncbi:MAG: CDP-glycerol glycerophosphotransferase family protein [Candidatus Atribacteria bacterium]|nr:CDP-glycerol glycerophosphotransferase family protein [Candidatus Atribacteria bacterium]
MILKNLAQWAMDRFLALVTDIEEGKILLCYTTYSGSNTIALYKLAPESVQKHYRLVLHKIWGGDLENLSFLQRLKYYAKMRTMVFSSQCVVTTHGPFRFLKKKGSVAVEAWHGFPLKAMGFMEVNPKGRVYAHWAKCVDFILSYSTFYSTLMNACIGCRTKQYVVTGMPRNDFLFKSRGKELLEKLARRDLKDCKIAFYLPTFREHKVSNDVDVEGEKLSQNIFRLQDFSWKALVDFLEKHRIQLVFKPHPFEAQILKNLPIPSQILLLTEEMLEEEKIDLYELLNSADVLITDYSSVYFDYLLLDRPIIFIPTDLTLYKKRRGLLLEPYDFWTPGPKVYSYQDLEKEILEVLDGRDNYKDQRKIVRNIVHLYQDGQSTERVWSFLTEILEK